MTPAALDLLNGLVLEDGRRWGEVAAPFQVDDATAVLDVAGSTRLHFLTRPRGASKTTDLAGVALVAMLEQLPSGSLAIAVAADRDQARLLLAELAGFIRRTPGLSALFTVETWSITVNASGARLVAIAADGPSAFGLRPHLTIADEIAQWPSTPGARQVWEAIISAVPKVATGRLVLLTTAGAPEHWSYRVREQARTSARWRLHEVPGPCPWVSAADLEEQRALLTDSQYARLHLNRWTAGEDRLTTMDAIRECVTLDGPLDPVAGRRYVIALDVGLVKDRTAATVAHLEARGTDPAGPQRVVMDRMAVWQGSRAQPVVLDEVEAWLALTSEEYNRAPLVYDPHQAAHLTQRLQARGLRTIAFNFTAQSVGRLAQRLYGLFRDRALALPDDAELLVELASIRLRETSPGVFRIDHDADKNDDRAISLAMAAEHLLSKAPSLPIGEWAAGWAESLASLEGARWEPLGGSVL